MIIVFILMLLCSTGFGDDATLFLGGSGTKADASNVAPGCVTTATWIASLTDTDFMTANGGALALGAGVTWTIAGNTVTINDGTSPFTGLTLTGMYIYCYSNSETPEGEGYYEITADVDNDNIEIKDAGLGNATTFVNVAGGTLDYTIGGAGDISDNEGGETYLQDHFDLISGWTDGGDNLDILINEDCTIDTTVDIEFTGSITRRVRLLATDGDFLSDGTNVTIDTNTALAGALWEIGITQVNVHFYDFTLDAGANANDATHCLELLDGSANGGLTRWYDCTFQGATDDNIRCDAGAIAAGNWAFQLYNPTITGAGAAGIGRAAVGTDCILYIKGGVIHGNTGAGVEVSGVCNVFDGIIIYGNAEGFNFDGFTKGVSVSNCTIDDTGDAFVWDGVGASSDGVIISNCSITNSDVDFAPTGSDYADWVVTNCLLNGNTATYTPVIGIMTQRNIQTGVPGYVGAPDYTPATGSNLIDNGVVGTGDTIGALCATAGAGGGAGVIGTSWN